MSHFWKGGVMTIRVCDLPLSDRPLHRLDHFDKKYLTNVELLAIIIGTEQGIIIAQDLFARFKTLDNIYTATTQELTQTKNVGKILAGKILASLELSRRLVEHCVTERKTEPITTPESLYELIKSKVSNHHKEHFFVCSLDTRNNLIAVDEISIGTLTASLVHPRETFEMAIRRHAAQIILAHNHPSGETDPSEDDLKITKRLVDAGKIMGIDILDHLIITNQKYLSFKEKNLI